MDLPRAFGRAGGADAAQPLPAPAGPRRRGFIGAKSRITGGNACARGYRHVSSIPLTSARTTPIPTVGNLACHFCDGGRWTVGGITASPSRSSGWPAVSPARGIPPSSTTSPWPGGACSQPAAALPGRPLRAAVLDDWTVPQVATGDLLLGELEPEPPDLEPVQKLAAEMTALALTDAGLLEAAGTSRTGLIIASTAAGLGDLVREQFGFPAHGPYPRAAETSSLHAVAAAAAALQAGELDLAVAGGAELGLDPVLARAAGPGGHAGHRRDARLLGRPGRAAARGWVRCRGAGPRGRRPGGGPAGLRGDRGLEHGARLAARAGRSRAATGIPAGRDRSRGHPAHRGPGNRDRGRGFGRAGRAHAAQAGRGGRHGARRGLRRHRLHQGRGRHRQPGQGSRGDGRGNDPARPRVRAAASAHRVGRRAAPAASRAGALAGRRPRPVGSAAAQARRGELAGHGRRGGDGRAFRPARRRRDPPRAAP